MVKQYCVLIFYSVLIFLLVAESAFSQDKISISNSMYHRYEGTYKFKNGKIITGGLMDEIEGHMVFIEPFDVSMGGLFRPIDQKTFQALSSENTQIQYEVNGSGEVKGLWWEEQGKEALFGKKISSYTIEEVQWQNGNITLVGELRMPEGPGPHPVIINVHGSGKQTRHMGPWNTLFLEYGIGILSYDKRGAGESTGDFAIAGYKDFADDVLSAVEFLKHQPNIDTTKIGLHGSSEGGWVSAIAASKTDDLAFMMIRAGSGVSGGETYIHEVKNELKEYDLTDREYREAVQFERQIQYMAKEYCSLQQVNKYIDSMRTHQWFAKVYDDWDGVSEKRWIKMRKTGPVDPAIYLRKVGDIPVLWFLADEDENVPYELSKPRIKVSLEEAGNMDFEIVTLFGANHAFLVPAPNGSMKYADGYWNKMIAWLRSHHITSDD